GRWERVEVELELDLRAVDRDLGPVVTAAVVDPALAAGTVEGPAAAESRELVLERLRARGRVEAQPMIGVGRRSHGLGVEGLAGLAVFGDPAGPQRERVADGLAGVGPEPSRELDRLFADEE